MTFTYTPSSVTDVTRVRFHIGDTVEATAIFSDEEIKEIEKNLCEKWNISYCGEGS